MQDRWDKGPGISAQCPVLKDLRGNVARRLLPSTWWPVGLLADFVSFQM